MRRTLQPELPVELLGADHHLNGIGDQVTYRISFSDTFPNECRGNVEQRRVNSFDIGMRSESRKLHARPGIDIKSIVLQDPFMAFPLGKTFKVVAPHDHLELSRRVSF